MRLVVLEERDDVAEVAPDDEDVVFEVEDEHELGASGMLEVTVSVEVALDATISFEMEVAVVVDVTVFAGCNSGATSKLDEIRTAVGDPPPGPGGPRFPSFTQVVYEELTKKGV